MAANKLVSIPMILVVIMFQLVCGAPDRFAPSGIEDLAPKASPPDVSALPPGFTKGDVEFMKQCRQRDVANEELSKECAIPFEKAILGGDTDVAALSTECCTLVLVEGKDCYDFTVQHFVAAVAAMKDDGTNPALEFVILKQGPKIWNHCASIAPAAAPVPSSSSY